LARGDISKVLDVIFGMLDDGRWRSRGRSFLAAAPGWQSGSTEGGRDDRSDQGR
jgi:hypothetical protein